MDKNNNKPDWIIISIVAIVITLLTGMCISEYLSYLTNKQKNETIREAIEKNWSIENIQGLLNATKNEN